MNQRKKNKQNQPTHTHITLNSIEKRKQTNKHPDDVENKNQKCWGLAFAENATDKRMH